jgi:hypothetical protein
MTALTSGDCHMVVVPIRPGLRGTPDLEPVLRPAGPGLEALTTPLLRFFKAKRDCERRPPVPGVPCSLSVADTRLIWHKRMAARRILGSFCKTGQTTHTGSGFSVDRYGKRRRVPLAPESDPTAWLFFWATPLVFLRLALAQPHPRAAAVSVDEFDAAVFKRGSDFPYRFFSSPQLTVDRLQSSDRRFRDARPSG